MGSEGERNSYSPPPSSGPLLLMLLAHSGTIGFWLSTSATVRTSRSLQPWSCCVAALWRQWHSLVALGTVASAGHSAPLSWLVGCMPWCQPPAGCPCGSHSPRLRQCRIPTFCKVSCFWTDYSAITILAGQGCGCPGASGRVRLVPIIQGPSWRPYFPLCVQFRALYRWVGGWWTMVVSAPMPCADAMQQAVSSGW